MGGIYDRLILNAFDTQHDSQTISRTIGGQSEGDIGMHRSPRDSFFLALFRRDGLDRTEETRCVLGSDRRCLKNIIWIQPYQSSLRRRAVRGCFPRHRARQSLWGPLA
jgi:hypothetical protein